MTVPEDAHALGRSFGERTARTLLGSLLRHGIVGSVSDKGPVSLRFPMEAQEVLFPRLYVETWRGCPPLHVGHAV